MTKKLEWNVYISAFNGDEIKTYNIFNHTRFMEDVKKYLKKCKAKEEFVEEFKKSLMWCFWSKCEWETVVTSFSPRIDKNELDRLNNEYKERLKEYGREPYSLYVNPTKRKKIDVYDQCMLNFDILVDYVWKSKGGNK